MDFASRLRQLRRERGLTQSSLAGYLGISKQAISNYETRANTAPQDVMEHLADIFNVSIDYLMGRSDFQHAPCVHGHGDAYSLPPELQAAFRGRRWDQLRPETRRIIVRVVSQIEAELEHLEPEEGE
ncbi:MAG: helix-turn-helix transcriptional regulator [Clostridia bacterium]|nr:helix-turn-helix transcriptional regulator [Clostridia bacterium]